MTKPRRVLVCGGRSYPDHQRVFMRLDEVHGSPTWGPIGSICQGGAPGVDHFAYNWAIQRGVSASTFEADWETHGRAAGPIRNRRMLDEFKPDLVIAFPGGPGTENMCKQARTRKITILHVE